MNKTADWLNRQIKEIVHGILARQPGDKLGRIDPAYTSGLPRVIFDGEEAVSGKRYPFLTSYTPVPNDRVYLKYVKGSYVITGRLSAPNELVNRKPITPTFLNGWSNYFPADRQLVYYRNEVNQLTLRGTIRNATPTVASTIFVLPVGFRPAMRQFFAVPISNGVGEVSVNTNGEVGLTSFLSGSRADFIHLNITLPLD